MEDVVAVQFGDPTQKLRSDASGTFLWKGAMALEAIEKVTTGQMRHHHDHAFLTRRTHHAKQR